MNTNLTELVFILDRSGSMGGLEQDTIGGFNAMLKKQKDEPGSARVTTVLFDNAYEVLHDRLDLEAMKPITDEDYFVRGSTALLDAIGYSIIKVDKVLKGTVAEHRADKVLFVVITDGMENASRAFTREKLFSLVSARREMGWEFLFLGANMDAIQVAGSYGFSPQMAQTYMNDGEGVEMNYRAVSDAVRQYRCSRKVSQDWSREIKEREGKQPDK